MRIDYNESLIKDLNWINWIELQIVYAPPKALNMFNFFFKYSPFIQCMKKDQNQLKIFKDCLIITKIA